MGLSGSKDNQQLFETALAKLQVNADGTAGKNEEFFTALDGIEPLAIHSFVSGKEVSTLRAERPTVLILLIDSLIQFLAQAATEKAFRRRNCFLCCVELLSCVMLGLFEERSATDGFIEKVFFDVARDKCSACRKRIQQDWVVCPYCEKRLQKKGDDQMRAFALCKALLSALFVPGVTSSPMTVWQPSSAESNDGAIINAREQVLSCLLGVLAEPLLMRATEFTDREKGNRWIDALMRCDAPLLKVFFQSIMNVSLTPISPGWLSGIVYEDRRILLRRCCSYVSLVLLNGRLPNENVYANSLRQVGVANANGGDEQLVGEENLFVEFLAELDNKFLFLSISKMLEEPEMFALACGVLWNCVQENTQFVDYVLQIQGVDKIIVPILAALAEGKSDVKKQGPINLAIFILLALSSRRNFGVSLNFTSQSLRLLPKIGLEINPSLADALFFVVESVVNSGSLVALHECLLTALCNISPYQKNLAMTSSVALMRLSVTLSSRTFLLREERGCDLLSLCLDCVANILQYQYEGNRPLTYAVVSYRARLLNLWKIVSDKEMTIEQYREDKVSPLPFHTKSWFDNWRKQITPSLRVIIRILQELVPALEKIEATNAELVMSSISKTTIVGLLPPAPPLVIRKTARSKETDLWLAKFVYSMVSHYQKLALLEPLLLAPEEE